MTEVPLRDAGDHGRPHEVSPLFPFGEVPMQLDILPESGREILVVGDVEHSREFQHRQGDNQFGFQGTCGLVACENVLRQFGVDVTEDAVVRYAVLQHLCVTEGPPARCGGTTEVWQAQILSDAGVLAHVEEGASLSDLHRWVTEGRGVILEVNAGELWNDPNAYEYGQANHAIIVTGEAVDPVRGTVLGFYINDSGRGYTGDAGRFISLEQMQRMWADPGGNGVITDRQRAH